MKYTRRNFLKLGGSAVLGAVMLPQFLQAHAPNSQEGIAAILSNFGVDKSDLQKVITAALEKGGDYADLFFENSFYNSLTLMDGAVNRASSSIDFGMGVRVLKGDQTGYAYVEDINLENMLKAARTASAIASGNTRKLSLSVNEKKFPAYYSAKNDWRDITIPQKAPYLQKLNDAIFKADTRVVKASVFLSDSTSIIMFYNSEGTFYTDYRPMVVLGANCTMEQEGKRESGAANRAYRHGFEFMTDDVVNLLAKESVDLTSKMFEAVKPDGGEIPVVMGAGGSGILLHEAIGHAFEADFNRKNISIFSDKLNKKVCDEHISVVDDGTIVNNRGAVSIDDEGAEGQKTYIVKDGILTSYLHDRISAKHYGVAPTGNGRRESFRNMPIPRMRVTYMENGNVSEQDIISSVKKGIYVKQFTNGQVNIGAGDFTFFVKLGYLIEDGKLTQPIKDINIIGNGPKALADITMVANNLELDNGGWTCGKDGQSCPVTQGMPSALVKKLTVGGK
ncbi:MAG: TldD/PmbA family protein [Prevotellaceae bacterium]|nr:TldD/PmbA family protein [Prevotellaceae bacterium]